MYHEEAAVDTETTRTDGGPAPALAEVLDGLVDLLQTDHDAVAAYDIAIEKLEDRTYAEQILGFRRDHERHIRELNELIGALGGMPVNEPHATAPFKNALQGLGALAGDRGLLVAFRTNELQVRSKYDLYAARANHWPVEVKRAVDRSAMDEERHYRWVADVLQLMGIGQGEGPELDAASKARERALSGGTLDAVREKVTDLAGTVRERMSTGADAVTNRIAGLLEEEGPLAARAQQVRGGLESGLHAADEARVTVEDRVRQRPVQTLLLAGLAGFVLGRILR
jgi:rubrerythrin